MDPKTRQSAFLEFVGEEATVYRVRNGETIETLPKSIHPSAPAPGEDLPALRRAGRFLRWALIGLLPAGLGTVIFAPLAALNASQGLRVALEPVDQRRALLILSLSVLVLLAALPLVYLFALHL